MKGLKVGHFTNKKNGTGVSVFLTEKGAKAAYIICGSGPASHELAALDLENSVGEIHGLVLAGGSAFGLFAAQGVMRYLSEREFGYPTPYRNIPIVPAAALFDLNYLTVNPPTEDEAFEACVNAFENNLSRGRIGAGTGASVGKLIPNTFRMSSGVGTCGLSLADGLSVLAYAIVNAVGDVINEAGKIVAGAQYANGEFANCETYLLSGNLEKNLLGQSNTTLVAVFTNAKFTKSELKRIAKMALAGMSRTLSPVFTPYDGDILFCISVGNVIASELTVGTMAARAVRLSILNAVEEAEKII